MHGFCLRLRVQRPQGFYQQVDETTQRLGGRGNAVVWPSVVVILLNLAAHNLGAVQQPQRAQRDVVIQLPLSFQYHREITY